MIVTLSHDTIPHDERAGYMLSGWLPPKQDGDDTLRTNVVRRINGVRQPVWPVRDGDGWLPVYVTVTE